MKLMSIQDSVWTWIETPETPMQVASLSIFHPSEPAADFARRVVEEYRTYAATSRPFNYLIHHGLMPRRQEIDDVDIDYHFRHSALPQPGGQRELGVLISRLHSAPLDPRRPMWEAHLIEGLEGNRVALYVKAHHSLFDGVAGVRMLAETFAKDPAGPLPPPPWARDLPPRGQRPAPETGARKRLANTAHVVRALRTLGAAGRHKEGVLVGPFQSPRSALNVPISPQRRVSTATVELDRVTALAEASGSTLNDIVLALCSTALRRYLQDLDELPAQPLTAMCPVSVRPADGEAEGNAVSMILASLATDEADPVARLRIIAASTAAGKKHLRSLDKAALTAYSSLAMAPHFVRQLVPGAARGRPMFNVVISNVPGPRQPLYAAGARMESFFPVSLLFKNEALNITVLSYDGHLNFGFTADRSALPHVQDVAVYTVQALDELEDAVKKGAGQ